jgi:hypothetical protein
VVSAAGPTFSNPTKYVLPAESEIGVANVPPPSVLLSASAELKVNDPSNAPPSAGVVPEYSTTFTVRSSIEVLLGIENFVSIPLRLKLDDGV